MQYIPRTSDNEIALLADRKQRIHAPEAVEKVSFVNIFPTNETRGRLKIVQWASSWVFFITPHFYGPPIFYGFFLGDAVARQVFGFGQRSRMTGEGDTSAQ